MSQVHFLVFEKATGKVLRTGSVPSHPQFNMAAMQVLNLLTEAAVETETQLDANAWRVNLATMALEPVA